MNFADVNPNLLNVGRYIRDLLTFPEGQILFGRINEELYDLTTDLIVIDSLASTVIGEEPDYDGVNEVLSYRNRIRDQITIDIYGSNAYTYASKLRVLIKGEASYELQRTLGIGVYHVGNIQDLKFLGGTQYSNRINLEMGVQYLESVDVNTLRIDEAQFSTLLFNE